MDINECYNKLKDYTAKEITTKELNELGLTKHYINKMLTLGKLERKKRGTYIVKSLTKKQKKRKNYHIRGFCESISLQKYDRAYMKLIRANEEKVDNTSDNLLRVAFILMAEILEYRDPSMILDGLNDLNFVNNEANIHWNNFCLDVVKKDYSSALKNIEAFKEYHIKKDGKAGDVTLAMCDLVNKVISLNNDRALFTEDIDKITNLIGENRYVEALAYGNQNISKINDTCISEKYESLLELIKTLISLKNGEIITIDSEKMANYGRNHPKILLSLYLRDKNYPKALEYIEYACSVDGRNYNLLIKKLLLEFQTLSVNKKNNKKEINLPAARYHFKNFLNVYRIDNLENAIRELSLSVSYFPTYDINYLRNSELLRMLEKFLRMQNNGEILEDLDINYNLKDAPINNFNKAVEYGDYKKAAAFKNLVNNYQSDILNIKVEVLNEMIKLDRINREKQKENNLDDHKESEAVEEIKAEKIEEKPLSDLEISMLSIPFSYKQLYEYIKNHEYDKALIIISKEKTSEYGRLCDISLRLIKVIQSLVKGNYKEPIIEELSGDPFKDFYRSLSNYDYESSLNLANDILEYIHDPEEFKVYKMLLEHINDLNTKIVRSKEIKEEIFELSNKSLTEDDLYYLMDIVNEEYEIKKEITLPNNYDHILAQMADMALYGITNGFSSDDFYQTTPYTIANPEEKFTEAINTGNYITVYNMLNMKSWNPTIVKKYSIVFLKLAKKITYLMLANIQTISPNNQTEVEITEEMEEKIKQLADELMTPEEKVDENKVLVLHQIRSLAKSRHYEEAYQLYLSSDISYNDPEVIGNLILIRNLLEKESEELYNRYLRGIEENDPDTSKYLNEYKDYISRNFMENTSKYKEKNLTL